MFAILVNITNFQTAPIVLIHPVLTSKLSGNDMNNLFHVLLLATKLVTVIYTGGFRKVRVQHAGQLVKVVVRKTTQLRSIGRRITETLVRKLGGGCRHVGTFSVTPHSICDPVTVFPMPSDGCSSHLTGIHTWLH
jgi:hypothetical protein